jgi:hypothetical protein
VHAKVFATRTVRMEAARDDVDESGVLACIRRDEDVVVSGTPVERLSRRGGGDGDGGQKNFQKLRGDTDARARESKGRVRMS